MELMSDDLPTEHNFLGSPKSPFVGKVAGSTWLVYHRLPVTMTGFPACDLRTRRAKMVRTLRTPRIAIARTVGASGGINLMVRLWEVNG